MHVTPAPVSYTHLDVYKRQLDQQRTFFLASAARSARPDFILGINAARLFATDQGRAIVGASENRIMLEGVVPGFDGDESGRQRSSRGVGGAIVGTSSAIGAGIEIEHVLPGEVLERLYSEGFHLLSLIHI